MWTNIFLSFWCYLIVAAVVADLVTTLVGLRLGAQEDNSISKWFLSHGGRFLLTLFMSALATGFIYVLAFDRDYAGLVIGGTVVLAVRAVVVYNNWKILMDLIKPTQAK